MSHSVLSGTCKFLVLWISPNSWVAHRTTHGRKLGGPNHCLVARIILTYLLKTFVLVINTKFACFLFNHVLTYWELGRPSGHFGAHVGLPDRVIGCIWRLGDLLSAALLIVRKSHPLPFRWTVFLFSMTIICCPSTMFQAKDHVEPQKCQYFFKMVENMPIVHPQNNPY